MPNGKGTNPRNARPLKSVIAAAANEPLSPSGTILYLAPEAFSGYYDTKIDIWAMGCTLCEFITGYPLFRNKDEITSLGQNQYIELIHILQDTPSEIRNVLQMQTRLIGQNTLEQEFLHS